MNLVWDGVRLLPYSDVDVAAVLGSTVALYRLGFWDPGSDDKQISETQFGRCLHVEFGPGDGSSSAGWLPELELRAAMREDLAEGIANLSMPAILLRRYPPSYIFDFSRLCHLFVRFLIPTQAFRPAPIFYHPANLEIFGLM